MSFVCHYLSRCFPEMKNAFWMLGAVWLWHWCVGTGEQYKGMVEAVDTVIAQNAWDSEDLGVVTKSSGCGSHLCHSCPQDTYVWLDYSSIPQRHTRAHTLPQKHNGCCAGQQASTFPNRCHQLPHRLRSQGELAKPKCKHGMVILESFDVIHVQNYW